MNKEIVIYITKCRIINNSPNKDFCFLSIKSNNGVDDEIGLDKEGCIAPAVCREARIQILADAIKKAFETAQAKIIRGSNELYHWRIKLNAEDDYFGRGNEMGMCIKYVEEAFTPEDKNLITEALRKVEPTPNKS